MPNLTSHEIIPEGHASVAGSRDMVVMTCAVLPSCLMFLCLFLASIAQRRARIAGAAYLRDAPLQPGRAVLFGAVELARHEPFAVRAEIEQRGTESKGKNGWTHAWTERSRTVTARPFYIAEQRGARIRVEPPDNVQLVDEMDRTEVHSRTERTKQAELGPGEEIYAIGELVNASDPEQPSGYRMKEGTALVLRQPQRGRMLLSSKPLSERFTRLEGFHRKWLYGFAGVAVFFQVVNVGFYWRALMGEHTLGSVVSKRHYVTRSKSSTHDHWEVTVEKPKGGRIVEDLRREDYDRLEQGSLVPIVYTEKGMNLSQVGPAATQHVAVGIMACVVFFGMLVAYGIHRRSIRPWYERKLVEHGSGRLPEVQVGKKRRRERGRG